MAVLWRRAKSEMRENLIDEEVIADVNGCEAEERNAMKSLVGCLGGLPLALEQAGMYLSGNQISFVTHAVNALQNHMTGDHSKMFSRVQRFTIRSLICAGKPYQAEPLCRQSLAMQHAKNDHDENHAAKAQSLNNLAVILDSQGRLDETEFLHCERIAMERQVHGVKSTHPDIAASLNDLANIFVKKGRLDEAVSSL